MRRYPQRLEMQTLILAFSLSREEEPERESFFFDCGPENGIRNGDVFRAF